MPLTIFLSDDDTKYSISVQWPQARHSSFSTARLSDVDSQTQSSTPAQIQPSYWARRATSPNTWWINNWTPQRLQNIWLSSNANPANQYTRIFSATVPQYQSSTAICWTWSSTVVPQTQSNVTASLQGQISRQKPSLFTVIVVVDVGLLLCTCMKFFNLIGRFFQFDPLVIISCKVTINDGLVALGSCTVHHDIRYSDLI